MSIIKNPPVWLGPDKEYTDFMNYVAEQTRDVNSIQPMTKLCRDFIEKSGSKTAEKCFYARIRKQVLRIHELEEFDDDTKVRMLFALSVPVDSGFLNKLKKDAVVEFDNVNRITKYEKNDGGLKLIRDRIPPVRQYDTGDDTGIMNFLAIKAKIENAPITDLDFVSEFKDVTGSEKPIMNLKNRYQHVKRQIYLSTEYDKPTCIRMLFISGATIYGSVLEELRTTATVEIDDHQRITKYQANDGSMNLEGEHKRMYRRRSWNVEETKENLITRNRKTPKRLFPNEDFVNDFPDDDPKTLSNKKPRINNVELTTQKIPKTETSSNFSPKKEAMDHVNQSTSTISKPSAFSNLQNAFSSVTVKKEMSFDNATPSTLPDVDIEEVYARKLLEWLRLFICSLDSEELMELQMKVDLAITECGNEKVSIIDILQVLRTGIRIMRKSFVSSDEPTINCSDCLLNLHTTLLTVSSPSIMEFQQEIKYIRTRMKNREELILVANIRPSLETILLLASS